MESNELKLDIQKPRIVKGIYGTVMSKRINILSFRDLDRAVFPEGFFSNEVKYHIMNEFIMGNYLSDEIFQLISDKKHEHWFDIKKDINCKYFFLAGDEFGVKYYGRIHGITFMISDIKIGLEEDNRHYYINAGDIFSKCSKYKFTLKSAIVYAMRKVNPNIFPDLNFE